MLQFLRTMVTGFLWLVCSLAISAQAMTFELRCMGNATESCFLFAHGEFTTDTPKVFEAHLAKEPMEGSKVLFDSGGGNLGAGIALGRLIRERGLSTYVGSRTSFDKGEYPPRGGRCLSACAYAFLGGVNRALGENSKLGFHQFFIGAGSKISSALDTSQAFESAQKASAFLISYLVEMGVDARIFVLASAKTGQEMHLVTEEEARKFDLVTPVGYGAFFLEPYGKGIVASAKRQDEPSAYDMVQQVTAFCKNGRPTLLFFASAHGLSEGHSAAMNIWFERRDEMRVAAADVSVRASRKGAYVQVRLTDDIRQRLTRATVVETAFEFARAEGGSYGATFNLTDMDRKMLDAAFRFCL